MGKLSLDIYKEAKAIYPLRRVEVRKTEIMSEPSSAGPAPTTPEQVAPQTLP
jgi:small subunit ribosomal protein S3Ae